MKAGDAVMLALLECADWDGARFEPHFVFYEREEGPYAENGLEAVFAGCPWVLEADLAIVPEPTDGTLEVGCVGTCQDEVTYRGKSSHAARPWQGENAITKAGRCIIAQEGEEDVAGADAPVPDDVAEPPGQGLVAGGLLAAEQARPIAMFGVGDAVRRGFHEGGGFMLHG